MRRFLVLVLLVTLATSTAVASAASKRQEQRCDKYQVVNGSRTWSEAKAHAQEIGGRLATVSSAEEQACVAALGVNAWLGGTDGLREGEWRWVSPPTSAGLFWVGTYVDGRSLGFSNWNSGEPNQSGNEDCLEIGGDGRWNDLACTNYKNAYVIRYP